MKILSIIGTPPNSSKSCPCPAFSHLPESLHGLPKSVSTTRLRHPTRSSQSLVCAFRPLASESAWTCTVTAPRLGTRTTTRALAQVGIEQDVSFDFPERVGFRCETCIEHTAIVPVQMKPFSLRIRPLVAMDITFMPGSAIGLPISGTLRVLADLKQACRRVGGRFSLCWHNSELDSRSKRLRFESILDS